MPDPEPKVYGRRWLVLGVFVLIALMTQVLWITFAPITTPNPLYKWLMSLNPSISRSTCWATCLASSS